jgi:hypothetical protein
MDRPLARACKTLLLCAAAASLAGCTYAEVRDGDRRAVYVSFLTDLRANKLTVNLRPTTSSASINGLDSGVNDDAVKAITAGVTEGVVEGLKKP